MPASKLVLAYIVPIIFKDSFCTEGLCNFCFQSFNSLKGISCKHFPVDLGFSEIKGKILANLV